MCCAPPITVCVCLCAPCLTLRACMIFHDAFQRSCFFFLNLYVVTLSNRLRELENQLLTLEASKPSAPPALKFKVKLITPTFWMCHYNDICLN